MRIVVEIVSLNSDSGNLHSEVVYQLQRYLEAVGERWDQRLLIVAILSNEAYLMHITDNDLRVREVYEEADHSDDDDAQQNSNYWMSLFDHRVVEASLSQREDKEVDRCTVGVVASESSAANLLTPPFLVPLALADRI